MNPQYDPKNCGACGVACAPGEVCAAGQCSVSCPAGQTACNGSCVNMDSDESHCGACGNVCPAGSLCQNGECKPFCSAGETLCGNECVKTDSDPRNCGMCGRACASHEACVDGACTTVCPAGQALCNGACVNLNADPQNCGACGSGCATGEVCSSGACGNACPPGQSICNGSCVNKNSDPRNCGACGTSCMASEFCVNGACTTVCPAGLTVCSNACVNLNNDVQHCGACGNACAPGQLCVNGACSISCPAGLAACNNACVNPKNDAQNCGACGNACAAGEFCVNGACTTVCPAGQTICSNACVNLKNDAQNCGACGNACAAGQTCVNGTCTTVCPAGQTICNNACVNLKNDAQNCGACGNACAAGQTCVNGTCIISCPAGQTACQGACVLTSVDPQNCGACGNACAAGQTCVNGVCQVSCPAGQTACGNSCVSLKYDSSNCGGCGVTCSPGQSCVNGTCTSSTCQSGWALCGGTCVSIKDDENNCGACGNSCGLGKECINGTCTQTCVASLRAGITDPWGTAWDGLERGATNWANAKAACEAFGGRLPTPTELYRVSAPKTGAVGQTYNTNYLWSLAPYDPNNRMIVRLSDATVSYSSSSNTTPFRCVCPANTQTTFTGSNCYGPPGSECFSLNSQGRRYNFDKEDRAPLPKNAAVWECAFNRGHLADYYEYAEAIQTGAPNGSNSWLHTADDNGNQYSTTVKWLNVDLAWSPNANTSTGTQTTYRSFRCAGVNYASGTHPNTVPNEFVGSSNGYKGETQNNTATSWAGASDLCRSRGGHLARGAELAELIQQGLPNGSGSWIRTADEAGYDGTSPYSTVMSWSGTNTSFGYSYSTYVNWGSKSVNTYPYRCIYYPIDTSYTGPSASNCNGGCFQVVYGSGSTPARMWVDNFDRVPASLGSAMSLCLSKGGHLASTRDFTEAVRAGLPNGSGAWLLTWDIGSYNGLVQTLVKWTGTDTAFTNLSPNYLSWDAVGNTHAYRCVWTNELR